MQPLKFTPLLMQKVWGGEKIAPFKGIRTELDHIGESWELSGHPEHQTQVCGGEFNGKPLNTLLKTYGKEIMGKTAYSVYGDIFPLLVKFIDARDDLSIQVHPNDTLASQRHGCKGKTEMWYVIKADKGASLYSGFKEQTSPEEYEKLIAENRITDVLAKHDVSEGDVFFLPSGRVHAICSGCFLAEIQQTSDITYRIWDYGRLGLDGKPRELHTGLAKDAIDYEVLPDYRTGYEQRFNDETILVKCEYFTTSLLKLDSPFKKDISNLDSFVIVVCTEGSGKLVTEEGELTIHQGETALVCASSKSLELIPYSPMTILESWI